MSTFFIRSHDFTLFYRGPCKLCEIEERLAELQDLKQKHAESGSRRIQDVDRDTTLASTVATNDFKLSSLDQRVGAMEKTHCSCKEDDSVSTEGIVGDL